MNNDQKAMFIALIITCTLIGVIIYAGFEAGHIKAVPETSRFSIVDKYEDCKVVKFIPPGDAKTHYFLDCRK